MTHQISNASVIDRCEHKGRCDERVPKEDVHFTLEEKEEMRDIARRIVRAARQKDNHTPEREAAAEDLFGALVKVEIALETFFEQFGVQEEISR